MISDLFRTGKTSFIFHLKIPKPGEDRLSLAVAHVGDERSTSSCPATTALPCQDSPILLGRFSSLSLGEATRPGDCLSLALDQVTTVILLNLCSILVLCFMLKC